jgi:equilibrative nucleoside transporter 1/2/3
MSGQGGIAVLVSFVQVFLAVFSALGTKSAPEDGESIPVGTQAQSTLAGVGLWALGAIGTVACMSAHRYLAQHPDYLAVLAPIIHRSEETETETSKRKGREILSRVFRKNARLEFSVGWVFVVTLVSNWVLSTLKTRLSSRL